jgi:hypothetical protein
MNKREPEKLEIMKVECFGDYIMIVYKNQNFFDIFKKNGKLQERKYVADEKNQIIIKNIEFLMLPRLEWSDRYVDIVQ